MVTSHKSVKMILQLFVCLIAQLSLSFGQEMGYLRIMNGTTARDKQFPYQVGLLCYFDDSKDEPNLCGGTIISKRWILTAAHCLQEPRSELRKVIIYVGSLEVDESKPFVVKKSATIVHKGFNRKIVANDIGLIKLPKDLTFNDRIQPAIFPDLGKTYEGKMAIISGWGLTSKQQASSVLQYIRAPIITNEECEKQWNKQLKGKRRKLVLDSFICIDSRAGLPCRGDSGGPLVLDDGSRTLVGIVSHGYDAKCQVKLPDVLTRVSSFLDWIAEQTGGGLE
ncbi:brachyurin [Drosophila pseudoobscura]|uniref:Brachyurin n=1 Tax=Drosophila pseudoobscura pseudoobscura TaxID=46245 RepID=A0A6I8UDU6_DROPS|nr:brachyurin [Drosophila pseudoobscura]